MAEYTHCARGDYMKKFMDKDFLLETSAAQRLYRACENMPILDYHCHLNPQEIANNKHYANLSEIWLGSNCQGDHYKWRAMRAYGIEEQYITGDAAPYQKFLKWAETVEHLIGNPLYHWTHLELQRYFGITTTLTVRSAPAIWDKANALLQTKNLSVCGIFNQFNVYAVGTTDDPADSLEFHKQIRNGSAAIGRIQTKVVPSFRPDRALDIGNSSFPEYMETLGKAAKIQIKTVDDVVEALSKRLDFFVQNGCVASDHGMDMPPCTVASDRIINGALRKVLCEKTPAKKTGSKIKPVILSPEEIAAYKTRIYVELGRLYAKKNIVMQYHMNAIRDNNSKMYGAIGPNTGFDAVHDMSMSKNLAGLLDLIEKEGALPKTILYSLNPADYYPISTVMGCFQNTANGNNGMVRGKMQLGAAWWFDDHRDGMEEQLKVLANTGMLSSFVGMLTDSRSFLSYPRHEYFRRILCNVIGRWVDNGEFPADWDALEVLVKEISFYNAQKYFGL